MAKFIDRTGQKIGRLTFVKPNGRDRFGHLLWLVKCDCGKTLTRLGSSIVGGRISSCGCLFREVLLRTHSTHRHSFGGRITQEYRAWTNMKQRCLNPKSLNFVNYGGRGIKVCDKWIHSFENFFQDMGPKPSAVFSIERINNNGNYEPSNCKWASRREQNINRRNTGFFTALGQSKTIRQWSELTGLPIGTIRSRIKHGFLPDEVVQSSSFYENRNTMKSRELLIDALNAEERLRAQSRMSGNWHLYSKTCLDLAQLALELESIEQKENDTARPLPKLEPLSGLIGKEELKRTLNEKLSHIAPTTT